MENQLRNVEMTTIKPKVRAILQELTVVLRERYGERYVGLWLYGSHARGDAHSESDVDVLLILRDAERPTREIDRIDDVLADLNLRHSVLISVLPVDEERLKTAEAPFWRKVRRERIAA